MQEKMPRPNRYAHLSHEDKLELKDILQKRMEQAQDYYCDAFEEHAVIMNALMGEQQDATQSVQ